MGKGGNASVTAGQRSVKLVGDKSEKITWSEVKKHVSSFLRIFTVAAVLLWCVAVFEIHLSNNQYLSSIHLANVNNHHLINDRSRQRMLGLFTKTKSTMYRIGTNIQAVELSSLMLVMI